MAIQWHKVADAVTALPWQDNRMCVVEAAGKKITLAQHNNELFAFAYKCPHASGIMADGFIDAMGNAVCPLHRYKFNLANGRNVTGEGYYLKTYPVQEQEDGLYVGFEEKNWLSIFS